MWLRTLFAIVFTTTIQQPSLMWWSSSWCFLLFLCWLNFLFVRCFVVDRVATLAHIGALTSSPTVRGFAKSPRSLNPVPARCYCSLNRMQLYNCLLSMWFWSSHCFPPSLNLHTPFGSLWCLNLLFSRCIIIGIEVLFIVYALIWCSLIINILRPSTFHILLYWRNLVVRHTHTLKLYLL